MTVTATCLINAQTADAAEAVEYTSTGVKTIIDKFTAYNSDASSRVLTVYLVPSGSSFAASNMIVNETVSAGTAVEIDELKNHILNAGDTIVVKASAAGVVVIRASGRTVS